MEILRSAQNDSLCRETDRPPACLAACAALSEHIVFAHSSPTMTRHRFILLLMSLTAAFLHVSAADPAKDARCFEMRVYYSPAGKLDELHARFRNHTVKLFEK